ncbi:uncharacterized protein BJX67DRAFT_377925 [Aspergillus lucknowensis]|uniref:Rhodopsin domain-containing protein n=1 Tax=Aspergillus lucknowensis TaxID=176173 RepID=A0ABR4M191_9EURO
MELTRIGESAATLALRASEMPDYSNPLLRTANFTLIAVGLLMSTTCLVMRVYTKARLLRKFCMHNYRMGLQCCKPGADYQLVHGTDLLYLLTDFTLDAYAHSWLGIHVWDMTEPMLASFRKANLAFWTIYWNALAFSKFALLFLYLTLFTRTPSRRFTIGLTASTIAAYTVGFVVALILGCRSLENVWCTNVPGTCMNRPYFFPGMAIANTLSDLILILIPIPLVHELHLSFRQKMGMTFLFGVGCLTICVSIVRVATVDPLIGDVDQPYKIVVVFIFVIIEANFIIICGTLPFLRQFLRFHLPSLVGDSVSDRHTSSDDSPKSTRRPHRDRPEYDIELALHGMNGGAKPQSLLAYIFLTSIHHGGLDILSLLSLRRTGGSKAGAEACADV